MKKRVRRALNFFAFNLLFFALYLNFIHKDKAPESELTVTQSASVSSGSESIDNSINYLKNKATTANISVKEQAIPVRNETGTAQN